MFLFMIWYDMIWYMIYVICDMWYMTWRDVTWRNATCYVICGVAWRDVTVSSKMSNSISSAIASNPDYLFITGDFNYRCQHWDDSHPNSELGKKRVEVIHTLNLHQIIDKPTRYIEYSASISPGLLSNVAVLPPISTLDHCVISCSLAFTHSTERVYSIQRVQL